MSHDSLFLCDDAMYEFGCIHASCAFFALIVCANFLFGTCFVMQYLVSVLAEEYGVACFSFVVVFLSCNC